jgi:hypothetical protein
VALIQNRPITLARRPLPAQAELGDNYAFSVEVFLRKTSTSNRVFVLDTGVMKRRFFWLLKLDPIFIPLKIYCFKNNKLTVL